MKKIKNSPRFWQIISLAILSLFVINQINPGLMQLKNSGNDTQNSIVKTAHASEIYPMFSCPCCGQPLDKDQPCCGSAVEMINFIDQKVQEGLSDDDVILATAKQFGIERLINENDRNELKQKLIDLAPADAPQIEMPQVSRDLGTVSQKQGVITTDFELKNTGKSELVINKLSSSCGCTSGAIVYKGEVGPRFYMEGHGQENPKDWEVKIMPGDTATLRVYYDPSVHPDLVGAVTRTVSIMSNDPVEFEKQVTITLDQTK